MICPLKIDYTRCHTDEVPDTTEYVYQKCVGSECPLWVKGKRATSTFQGDTPMMTVEPFGECAIKTIAERLK